MPNNSYRRWIIYLSTASMLVTLWLVYNELKTPGFCPPYPGLGIPTCILVLVFFSLVLGSQFMKPGKLQAIAFQAGAIAGLATAIWFSVHQALGKAQCPELFSIPLCYVALATFLTLITLNQLICINRNACGIEEQ